MTDPKILAQDEQGNRRLVGLEAIHEVGRDGSLSLFYTASMTQSGVTLRRISSSEPSTQFYLDIDVMEALVSAWTRFQADNEARAIAEEEREQALIKEAYGIASRHPEIKIREGKGYWTVSIPSQGHTFIRDAYHPEQLFEQVETCRVVLVGRENTIGGDAA